MAILLPFLSLRKIVMNLALDLRGECVYVKIALKVNFLNQTRDHNV